jgi:MFS family permease
VSCESHYTPLFTLLLQVWGIAAFLGSALGPMVGGPLLYFFGKDGIVDEDQGYTIRGYAVILGLSSVYFFMSAATLRWVRNKDV